MALEKLSCNPRNCFIIQKHGALKVRYILQNSCKGYCYLCQKHAATIRDCPGCQEPERRGRKEERVQTGKDSLSLHSPSQPPCSLSTKIATEKVINIYILIRIIVPRLHYFTDYYDFLFIAFNTNDGISRLRCPRSRCSLYQKCSTECC